MCPLDGAAPDATTALVVRSQPGACTGPSDIGCPLLQGIVTFLNSEFHQLPVSTQFLGSGVPQWRSCRRPTNFCRASADNIIGANGTSHLHLHTITRTHPYSGSDHCRLRTGLRGLRPARFLRPRGSQQALLQLRLLCAGVVTFSLSFGSKQEGLRR